MTSPALNESVPVVTCEQARIHEGRILGGRESAEWEAMAAAGSGIADELVRDFSEIGGLPDRAKILAIVGRGHNGGDALIVIRLLLERFPKARAEVCFVFGERTLRPLTQRAWRELVCSASDRLERRRCDDVSGSYDLCVDGLWGFQFRSPIEPGVAMFLARVNRMPIHVRVAIDLPSGLGAKDAFRADFTYATGCVKQPLLTLPNAGRIRLIDLGWCLDDRDTGEVDRVLLPSILDPLRRLRSSAVDKRSFGHLGLIGGSRNFPGAILMAAKAALRSGVGLVTVLVPESLAPGFAAAAPEAMWIGWPETPSGSLSLEGVYLLRERSAAVKAWVVGPGMGREPEALAAIRCALETVAAPVVMDADALQPDLVRHGTIPRILTPHAGEWARIALGESVEALSLATSAVVVLKGPLTMVAAGSERYTSLAGGPVLARGGSGDVLAGLMGGLLAQNPTERLWAAASGVVWHGIAADLLARDRGQISVPVTQILDYLGPALRGPRPTTCS